MRSVRTAIILSAFLAASACTDREEGQARQQKVAISVLGDKVDRLSRTVDKLRSEQDSTTEKLKELEKGVDKKTAVVVPAPNPPKIISPERQQIITAYKNLDAYAQREGWSFERTEGVRKVLDERMQRLNNIEAP